MEKELPKNWVECSIGEIVSSKRGRKPSSTIDYQKDGYIPYILIDEMEGKPIRSYTNDPKVSIVNEKDVLIVWDGSIGKCGSGINGAIGSTLVALTPMAEIPTKFVEYLLIDKNSFIKQTSTGTGLQHINKDFFEICRLNLPPLAEQNRIVAKLDVLFAQLETIKASMAKVPLLLKDFRQQVLTQAVTGKLTEEWRKRKGLEEWINMKLENLTTKVGSGSTPKGGQAVYLDEGIPLIRSMNVHFKGINYEGLAFLDEKQANGLKNVEVFENDVLLNITGASIGRVCLAPNEMSGARVNQHVCIIRTNEIILPSFLNIYLSSPVMQKFINDENYGVTRQALTKGQILDLNIPVPNLKEQQEIVSRVERLFAKADAIEKQCETLKAKIDSLPQAILHKAFKGELTEQLDSDGDARELLKEIEGLKEQTAKVSKKKKVKV